MVSFKFNNGMEKKMLVAAAEIFRKRRLGTYMTTDMGHQPVIIKAPAVEVDSAGQAWDEALHVASKLKNNNGTWRKKPGAASVVAE